MIVSTGPNSGGLTVIYHMIYYSVATQAMKGLSAMTTPRNMMLKERAYNEILKRILNGQCAPGDLLNRRCMAGELQMSAAPVHEAMIQLERDGFLEALPRLGTRVRTANRDDVRGHLIVREALECQAAYLICGEPVRRHLLRLQSLAAMADAGEGPDGQQAAHEVSFHIALVELSDCPALVTEYRRVMQIGLFYRINLLMSMPASEPANRHLTLLDELAAAGPEEAVACARRHIWTGKPDALKR